MNAADNASLAARDRQLPGLPFVLNPDRLRERMIAEHALDATDKLELVYIRYKPGRRALALLSQRDSTGQRCQLVISAHNQDAWQKFLSTNQADELVAGHGMVLADAQCSVSRFPHDRRLSQVAKLFDASRTGKVLGRILDVQPPDSMPWQLDLLAYKPSRRLVAKASLVDSAWTIKCYTPGDYATSRERALGIGDERLAAIVPKITACNDRYCAIASQWIEGDTLASHLVASHARQPLLRQAGELLSTWHIEACRSMTSLTFRHTGFSHQTMLQLADDMKWILPELRMPIEEVLSTLEPWLERLQAGADIIHGDFYARQIIVEQDRLRLIDFDEVGRGHRYQDLGTFVGQLYWNAIRNQTGLKHLDSGIEAFLEGYSHRLGPLDHALLHASMAAGVLRCLPHPFRRGLPEWADKTKQILYWSSFWLNRAQSRDVAQSSRSCRDEHVQREVGCDERARYLDPDQLNQKCQRSSMRSSMRIVSARLLRYKPGRRLVVEYQTESESDNGTQTVIGKARLGKPLDVRLTRLHNDLQGLRKERVVVPRVNGELPDWSLWFQEKLLGQPVSPDSSPEIHRAVGVALARLHSCGSTIDRSHTLDDELRNLRKQHAEFLGDSERWSEGSAALLRLAEQRVSHLRSVQPVLLHRDFYFDQVLAMEGAIALVDFDTAAMGPAELDVGNYLAHLDEYGIRLHRQHDVYRPAAQAFVEGYREVRNHLHEPDVSIWRFLSLARLVAISQRIADRSDSTGLLLDLSMAWPPMNANCFVI